MRFTQKTIVTECEYLFLRAVSVFKHPNELFYITSSPHTASGHTELYTTAAESHLTNINKVYVQTKTNTKQMKSIKSTLNYCWHHLKSSKMQTKMKVQHWTNTATTTISTTNGIRIKSGNNKRWIPECQSISQMCWMCNWCWAHKMKLIGMIVVDSVFKSFDQRQSNFFLLIIK